jgi:hypothetical protein
MKERINVSRFAERLKSLLPIPISITLVNRYSLICLFSTVSNNKMAEVQTCETEVLLARLT